MLVVLAIGIACMAYGVTGRNIYNNAVVMMGSDKKTAMSFIQDPEKLTELGNLSKIGADNVKRFLKGFDLDAAAVDKAVDERAAFETAQANAKDRDKFFAYAQSVDETVTEDNFNDLIKDHSRSDPMRKAMAMEELGVDEAAYDTLAANETLLEMYRANLPKLLENNHMTNAVQIQFIGLVLVTVAFAYFITVPFMLGFLISFTKDVNVRDSISIGEYLNFLVTVFLIFGTVFEMPVISVILTRMGIIRAEWLAKARKVMIVVIFFLAAVITPPDVVSQVMVALPMLALYEIAILLSRIFRRK